MNAKRSLKSVVDILFAMKPKRKAPEKPKRILVLMCNYIGDTFWAMQAIPLLRRKWPAAETEIWAGVKPQSAALLNALVPNEHVIPLKYVLSDRKREPFSWRGFARELAEVRDKRFDIVLDLTFNRFSAIFSWLSAAKFTAGCDTADEFSALYDLQTSHLAYEGKHLALRPLAVTAAFAGLETPEETPVPKPPIPRIQPAELRRKLCIPELAKVAALFPGAGWESKRWTVEKFHEVAGLLKEKGFVVVAAGAPSEKELCEKTVAGIEGGVALNGTLDESITLITTSSAVVANDSLPAHLAAAFGVETAIVFCSSNPEMAAIGPAVRVLRCPCEFSAKPSKQHCAIFPATSCAKPQWMAIDAKTVVAALEKN